MYNFWETQEITEKCSMPDPTERFIIHPQPNWIRPAEGEDGVWHGYCGSGPEKGVKSPFGTEFMPERVDGVWYWVKKKIYAK